MTHESPHALDLRRVLALEHIAGSLCLIANHVVGGMTPEEVAEAKAEANALAADLRQSRKTLGAAISDASNTAPKET